MCKRILNISLVGIYLQMQNATKKFNVCLNPFYKLIMQSNPNLNGNTAQLIELKFSSKTYMEE